MSSYNLHKPEFSHEHRLGLVVYGGVSLAIYMNGICREFYNAVRGRGIYKLIKALTDSDIVVDIISGTSAGGINGVLLSYALTNSTQTQVVDFEEFAQIWREDASISSLMNQPSSAKFQTESVLDGSGYYQTKLADAFKTAQDNQKSAPAGEWTSSLNELDLFITGTDFFGRVHQHLDSTGALIEVREHRNLFHLKHRQGRKEPFNPNLQKHNLDPKDSSRTPEQTYQALGKLCRITSCFPVAFPVVEVGLKEDADEIDQRLIQWGQLENRQLPEKKPPNGYKLHFIDGGVLDNKPFTYTLKEIYYRTANRPVDRKLFYIDANPKTVSDSGQFKAMSKPGILSVVGNSLSGLPRYESISNDLNLIKEHNQKVQRYNSLLADAENSRILTDKVADNINVNEGIYLKSRLISLRDYVLPLVLKIEQNSSTNSELNKQEILESTTKLLTEHFTDDIKREQEEKTLSNFGEHIYNLDVDYALRKQFYFVKKLSQLLTREPDSLEDNKRRVLLGRFNRQIKLLETIKTALNQLLSHPIISEDFYNLFAQIKLDNCTDVGSWRSQVYDRVLRLHRFLLDADGLEDFSPQESQKQFLEQISANFLNELPIKAAALALTTDEQKTKIIDWLPQKQISSILQQLNNKICKLNDNPSQLNKIWSEERYQYNQKQNDSTEFSTILRQLELASENLLKTSGLSNTEDLLNCFGSFQQLDQVLYPFEYLTDFKEKDLIEIIRFSPNDAQMGLGQGKTIKDKLAGDTLRAFGGFFKKSWRSNDLLWGRLDGLNRIVEALVTLKYLPKFREFVNREVEQGDFNNQEAYLEALVKESFPNAQESDCRKIQEHLLLLISTEAQVSEDKLKEILNDLVLEGHREILSTDFKNVVTDQIEQQFEWKQQLINENNSLPYHSEEQPTFQPVSGYFEQPVRTLVAGKLAEQAIESLSLLDKEDLFRHQYHVGQETVLVNIPAIVLTSLLTRLALIMRDIWLTSLGEQRALKLRKRIIFKFLDRLLRLFYWWLQFTQELSIQSATLSLKPSVIFLVQVVLFIVAVVALLLTIYNSITSIAIALGAALLFWLLGSTRQQSNYKS
ncbi:MAG: patatin-like protein [Symploca sp. SIO2B6]|nr:patatin-like protein [Symploca sp. SIO2B6]